jgi:hypothetical protein
MNNTKKKKRNTADKVELFRSCFSGLSNVYGTYHPETGQSWQVKKQVTNDTILAHLKGDSPYGVYLLHGDRTRAIAVDFDDLNPLPPMEFVNTAQHYRLLAYIETSKSKGFHVWIFFTEKGVKASKARLVVKHILEEIECPQTEIFPKHDYLGNGASFGNYINAPLFGGLVPMVKTVFIDPHTLDPYPDQWAFLEKAERVEEQALDDIIECNNLSLPQNQSVPSKRELANGGTSRFSLPICAQKMLQNGVSQYQRVSCFRLAVHLKRIGLPFELTVSALKTWAQKNRPNNGKGIITEHEIDEQTKCAFNKDYRGYGCHSEAVAPFCQPACPLNKSNIHSCEIGEDKVHRSCYRADLKETGTRTRPGYSDFLPL